MIEAPQRPVDEIDPRLAARRAEVARQRRRRITRWGIVLSVVLLLPVLAWWTTRSSLLAVATIDVRGNRVTTTDDVVAATALRSGEPMVDVDLAAVARRVEALPWVATATVTRRWPTTVVVGVTERAARVALNGDGGWRLVDRTGRVLAVTPELPAGLPVVTGPRGAGDPGSTVEAAALPAVELATSLPTALAGRVGEVRWAQDGTLSLTLAGDRTAILGAPDRLGDKLVAVVALLGADPPAGSTLDVRAPTAPAVQSGNPQALTGAAP